MAKGTASTTQGVDPITGVVSDKDVVLRGPKFDDTELLNINSIDDALELLRSQGMSVDDASTVLGNGFAILDTKDKDKLVGVPLVLLSWNFNLGDSGEFVSVLVMTGDGRKLVLNDGSTGVKAQLSAYSQATGKMGGLIVRNGLRRSDYTYDDGTGTSKPATTFYLDTSA